MHELLQQITNEVGLQLIFGSVAEIDIREYNLRKNVLDFLISANRHDRNGAMSILTYRYDRLQDMRRDPRESNVKKEDRLWRELGMIIDTLSDLHEQEKIGRASCRERV